MWVNKYIIVKNISQIWRVHHSLQLTPVKTKDPLTSITWLYCRLKFTADQGQVLFWSSLLTKCWFPFGSQAHVSLSCWKQDRNVRRAVTTNPGLKVNRIITFSSVQMFFATLFCVYGDYWNSKRNVKQYTKTSPAVVMATGRVFSSSWLLLICLIFLTCSGRQIDLTSFSRDKQTSPGLTL